TGHITLISDRDNIIAIAGGSRKEYMDKQIGELVETCMENRKTVLENGGNEAELIKDMSETYSSYVIAPIISSGDPIGSVMLVSKDDQTKMSEMEVKMAETAAGFLGKQMEQ